ncbi:hypothetical protein B0H12DRAFT_1075228 [Mycena haematopus]|nr:hypothetical protein B0H12DRAFT_1075228 [Mycena haematopus]
MAAATVPTSNPEGLSQDMLDYLNLWTPDDKLFASYWRHPAALPLLDDILQFSAISEGWPAAKSQVIRDINGAYPMLPQRLLKRDFSAAIAADIDPTLLDVWYGYTQILSLVGTGPKEWMQVM